MVLSRLVMRLVRSILVFMPMFSEAVIPAFSPPQLPRPRPERISLVLLAPAMMVVWLSPRSRLVKMLAP